MSVLCSNYAAVKLFDSALLNLINWIMYGTSVHSFVSDCHCNESSQPLNYFAALINWIVYVCTRVGLILNLNPLIIY